ncbi:hypothetical protein J6590_078111 [Homalodisca vitripennis]|nr:hypothetical protein J6590_078111 [Homalodisca vitripennis]
MNLLLQEGEGEKSPTSICISEVQSHQRSPQLSPGHMDGCRRITSPCPDGQPGPSGRRVSLSGRLQRDTSPPLGSPGL